MSPESPGVPDFLVIGAQKSGTTTLWEDLRAHPDLAMADKESNGLLRPDVTSPAGQHRYLQLFDPSHGTVRGEVCTTYAMLPEHPEVVQRARSLNPNLRIVYIVREPLSRVISHHHHDFALGLCGPDIDVEVTRHASLVNNTRYGTQITPWIDTFGQDRVHVVHFENYVGDRERSVGPIHDFLGVARAPLASLEAHNTAADKHVAVGAWAKVSESTPYRRLIRPLMSENVRRRLMALLLPNAPDRPAPPSNETLDHLTEILQPEVDRLADLTGHAPLWNLAEERAKRAAAG